MIGALPHTPLKNLFEKRFLRISKNFDTGENPSKPSKAKNLYGNKNADGEARKASSAVGVFMFGLILSDKMRKDQ